MIQTVKLAVRLPAEFAFHILSGSTDELTCTAATLHECKGDS